jgi:hypothetical protein
VSLNRAKGVPTSAACLRPRGVLRTCLPWSERSRHSVRRIGRLATSNFRPTESGLTCGNGEAQSLAPLGIGVFRNFRRPVCGLGASSARIPAGQRGWRHRLPASVRKLARPKGPAARRPPSLASGINNNARMPMQAPPQIVSASSNNRCTTYPSTALMPRAYGRLGRDIGTVIEASRPSDRRDPPTDERWRST